MPIGRTGVSSCRMTEFHPTEDGRVCPGEAQPIEPEEAGNKDGQAVGVTNGSTRAGPKKVSRICTVEEGQRGLEKAQLIEPEDALDTDALASTLVSTLVQISFFLGMSQATRDAVCASDAAVRVGSVQRPFLPNHDPHCGSGQLPS